MALRALTCCRRGRSVAGSVYMYSTAVPDWDPLSIPRPRPTSPSYYTGKSAYNDTLVRLEEAVRQVRRKVKGARHDGSTIQGRIVWRTPLQMADLLGYKLRTSEHRKIVAYLGQLAKMQPHLESVEANRADGSSGVAAPPLRIGELLNEFKRPDSASVLTPTKLKPLDRFGRSNTLGRRKEASAKIYMIKNESRAVGSGKILVNGKGLVDYFPRNVDRQQILWPLLVAGAVKSSLLKEEARHLGMKQEIDRPSQPEGSQVSDNPSVDEDTVASAINGLELDSSSQGRQLVQGTSTTAASSFPSTFNIFAVVQGGGRSGQAGAIAHGIAKALVQHATDLALTKADDQHPVALKAALNKAKTLKRDPRMVERKKTNQPKARARYTWVKR